uniref:Kinetochore protein SPC25 n=1 Tax=Propithecus coquereli TaxID=379532 RepID=A0A2K6ESZ7_PROCO
MVEEELMLFNKSINEFWNKFKSTDTVIWWGSEITYKAPIKAFAEKLSVKLKEEEQMVEMFLEYQNQICRQNNLLKLIAEVKGKKQELEVLTANIQDLNEEYSRKKETISTANKANFMFTNIDPKHPESPFMCSLHLNKAKDCEVSDRAPPLECQAECQENVRKTNSFSAFLKVFTAMVYN